MVSTSANLSGIRLNRRGRLARTFVVLSLAVIGIIVKSAGIGCLECKQPVIDAILAEQQPMFERAQKYLDYPSLLRSIIADGCDKARKVAQETMRDVREAMGLAYD